MVALKSYLQRRQALVNRTMERLLPKASRYPEPIHRAMRYSVLGEGKRIRPILALAACEAAGGKVSQALQTACALELIHAYSLVHDDLPPMDNDDFRRGKPSCHKQFGEALGILAGDALLTLAFEIMGGANHHEARRHLSVIREVARAIGTQGMIGGQVVDVAAGKRRVRAKTLEYILRRKTGALIAACVRVGALLGEAGPNTFRCLSRFGDRMGLVFQLVDDLLDGDGAVRVYGAQRVRQRAQRLTRLAVSDLAPLGRRAQPLRELAQFILTRES